MKKTFFLVIQFLFAGMILFAAENKNIEYALDAASKDIIEVYKQNENKENYSFYIHVYKSLTINKTSEIKKRLEAYLAKKNINVVEREEAELEIIEQEHNRQQSGRFESNIVNVANKYGANAVVFVTIGKNNNIYNLGIRIVDIDKGILKAGEIYEFKPSVKIEELLGKAYRPVSLGVGAEINLNSQDSNELFSYAGSISFDYIVFKRLSLGFKIHASNLLYKAKPVIYGNNYTIKNDLIVVEPLGMLRFYLATPIPKVGTGTGLFLDFMGGVSIVSSNSETTSNSNINAIPNVGVGLGFRLPLGWFYFEPEIRGGYPFMFGAGLNLGFRF